jgi:hypothetical protein
MNVVEHNFSLTCPITKNMTLGTMTLDAKCCYAQCHFSCRNFCVVMLSLMSKICCAKR